MTIEVPYHNRWMGNCRERVGFVPIERRWLIDVGDVIATNCDDIIRK